MKLTELPRGQKPEDMEAFRARIHRLETTDAERFTGPEPVDAVELYNELLEDFEATQPKYYEKRIRLCGLVSKVGPDEFGAPSFEFTDEGHTRCYALIVFPTKDIYEQAKEGDRVEIIGNVVFINEPYGLVVKKCELLNKVK